jgi:hypothetical protein
MLTADASRTSIHYAVDFPPQLGPVTGELANRIMREWGQPTGAAITANNFIQMRWKETVEAFDVTPTRLAWQATKSADFIGGESHDKHVSLIADAVAMLNLKTFKRVGLKTVSFLPLKMSHAEMCRLFFGTLLAPMERLEGALGQPKDPFIRIEGKYDELDYVLNLSAMSEEQIGVAVRSSATANAMILEGFPDSAFGEFYGHVTSEPSLYCDVDVYGSDFACNSMRQFFRDGIAVANKLAVAATCLLQSKPVKTGE